MEYGGTSAISAGRAVIRSMTGFGEGTRTHSAGVLRAELRSVNHRHLLVTLRLPESASAHEAAVREAIRGRLTRGHVSCSVRLDSLTAVADRPVAVRADLDRARDYLAALEQLRHELQLPGEVDLGILTRFGEVVSREAPTAAEPLPAESLLGALSDALGAMTRFREEEGERLAADLRGRLAAIEDSAARVEARAPARLATERERLRAAVQEIAEGVVVDPMRLAQEIAWLAEKWDINEELVRLRSHLQLFRELLDAPAEEPVGKRLGFVVQEMGREINTTGAKANDAAIAREVIGMKDELERLREQVDNVE